MKWRISGIKEIIYPNSKIHELLPLDFIQVEMKEINNRGIESIIRTTDAISKWVCRRHCS
jgi:hypothetical protein